MDEFGVVLATLGKGALLVLCTPNITGLSVVSEWIKVFRNNPVSSPLLALCDGSSTLNSCGLLIIPK